MSIETINIRATKSMKSFGQIVLSLLIGVVFPFSAAVTAFAGEELVVAPSFTYTVIKGEWQRTDGGYVIKVGDVQTGGRAVVEYFNPSPIHVAKAVISTQKELVKLFIKFQDKGYEGSTYTLYYYAEQDALAGFYYQAATNRTYEVIFVRKDGRQ